MAFDPVTALLDLGKTYIDDKEKQAEFEVKAQEIQEQLQKDQAEVEKVSIQSHTVPWVDASIKIIYALNDLVLQHYRPILSSIAFIWGVLHPTEVNDLASMGVAGQTAATSIFAAFPSWMYSRHKMKMAEIQNGNGN